MPMALNVISISSSFRFHRGAILQYKNKYIWGIRCQEGNMAGIFCPSLRRGYVLPLYHMSTARYQIIQIHKIVIMI